MVAKFLAAFSMFAKPLAQFGLPGSLQTIFRTWNQRLDVADHKRLIHHVKAQVFYEGSLSWKIDVSQGTGQGRILAPFMYKVYVKRLLTVLSNHCYAILINGLGVPSPSFVDDISLLTLHPSFLKTFMNICNRGGISGGMISITLKVLLLYLVKL